MPEPIAAPQQNKTPHFKFKLGPKTEVVLTLDTLAKWAGVFFLAGSLVYTAREAVHADVRNWFQSEAKVDLVDKDSFRATIEKVQNQVTTIGTSVSEIKGANEERTRSVDRIERMVEQLALREGVYVPPKAAAAPRRGASSP